MVDISGAATPQPVPSSNGAPPSYSRFDSGAISYRHAPPENVSEATSAALWDVFAFPHRGASSGRA